MFLNPIWWLATGSPAVLKMRNRVDVVPWSMLPTYSSRGMLPMVN